MVSKYFRIEELVDSKVFYERGEKAWELIDSRLVETIDAVKERFPEGTMTINNWLWGGNRKWSGLRTTRSPYYSEYSQHSFGRAVDVVFSEYVTEEVRQYILDNPEEFPYVCGVELDTGWLHIDVRNYDGVKTFKP